jgi:DNA-binding NtrC family response regulator
MKETSEKLRRVLVVDDDRATLELMRFQLSDAGLEVITTDKGREALELVGKEDFDIILSDLNLPDIDGLEIVRNFKNLAPDTEIIMITAFGSMEMAIEATKAGAFYYVDKPIKFSDLQLLIEKAIDRKNQAREIRRLRSRLNSDTVFEGIIGVSRQMREIYDLIESVADSDANIFIAGESGTGKEVVANAIHHRSRRAQKPFIKVNCSALPRDLIESQLFGHTKGAFTGATSDKAGYIDQSDGGSLLLDEIGEMPIELQPKLLRVLQEKAYYKVGSDRPQKVDFRLISATNRVPSEAVKQGILREDLFYRINTIEINIPPLRERPEDIPVLAEHFLKIFSDKYRPGIMMRFSPSAFDTMLQCPWRGNVRELQHAVERAVLLSKTELIDTVEVPIGEWGEPRTSGRSNSAFVPQKTLNTRIDFDDIDGMCNGIIEAISAGKLNLQSDVIDDIESRLVKMALLKTGGNKQAAARLLGMYRPRLYGIIKRHGLESGN